MARSNKRGEDLQTLKSRVLPLIKPHWHHLLIAMVCMTLVGGLTAAAAYLVKPVLDEIFFKKDMTMLKILPLAIMLLYILKGAAYFGQTYLMNFVGHKIIKQLRDDLYSHIQRLTMSFFDHHETGTLMARITNDVNIVKGMVTKGVTGLIQHTFSIIGLVFVIFYRDWKLALIATAVFPLATIPIVKFGRRMRRVSAKSQEAMADVNSFLYETLTGNKIVKAFNMEQHEDRLFFEKTHRLFTYEMKAVTVRAMSSPVMELLGGVGITLIIWYGGYKVIVGTSTPGTFFSFMAALIMLYEPVKKLSPINNMIQHGLAAVVRVYDILDTVPEIQEPKVPKTLKPGKHSVHFVNVHFQYQDDAVLQGINLKVKAGEVLALVGISGGGKTTLVNLIPRFYDVTTGTIYIDGIDIRELSLASLRSQVGIVTQDPILFNDTIRNNIAYGKADASPQEITDATKSAYAYDFINSFPNKLDTMIGERGLRLSGGQKQRICIARALLKNAPILILDEATSALDTESEKAVQKALENLMKGRTTFVIAHRLSTIRHADRIVVIVGGKIVEEGRHEDLLALNGEYRKLYDMQFEGPNTEFSLGSEVSEQ